MGTDVLLNAPLASAGGVAIAVVLVCLFLFLFYNLAIIVYTSVRRLQLGWWAYRGNTKKLERYAARVARARARNPEKFDRATERALQRELREQRDREYR
jgi:hypothetical protein